MIFSSQKFSILFLLIALAILLLSGCDDITTLNAKHPQETKIVAMEGTPYIVANIPGRYALSERFYNLNIEQLEKDSANGDGEAMLILGLIYSDMVTGVDEPVDKPKGLSLLQEAWRQGVVDAGNKLFKIYYLGNGLPVDRPLALAYLEASADKGYILSQRDLGHAYRGADPLNLVAEDIEKARYWFTRAAEQGDAESATQVAGIYREGEGVPKDEQVAFQWLKRAENMPFDGDLSYRGLSYYYENGIGTEVDLVQAYKYYDLRDPAGAADKRRLEAMMTPEQVQEAIRLSRAWQEEHRTFVPSYYGLEYQPDGSFK